MRGPPCIQAEAAQVGGAHGRSHRSKAKLSGVAGRKKNRVPVLQTSRIFGRWMAEQKNTSHVQGPVIHSKAPLVCFQSKFQLSFLTLDRPHSKSKQKKKMWRLSDFGSIVSFLAVLSASSFKSANQECSERSGTGPGPPLTPPNTPEHLPVVTESCAILSDLEVVLLFHLITFIHLGPFPPTLIRSYVPSHYLF
jgi:hypothetical protein